ncbi:MAG: hypothetical protein J6Y78_15650 [Paludibacteraceae bacterium]|nr:hypothetical protein [Paludibacteraceae bacterium]
MTEWKENSIKPEEAGYYLTTKLVPMMYGSRGGESYAWETDVSYYDGELWQDYEVLAWTELPCPYFTTEHAKKIELVNNARTNDLERERKCFHE